MKDYLNYILIFILGSLLIIAFTYSIGWINVHQISTIGKAKQNAQREVFEESNSFVKSKRQEAIKYYKEWLSTESTEDKKAIEYIVSMSLADFDEDKYISNYELLEWIKKIKY